MNGVPGNVRHFVKHADAPTQGIDLDLLSSALPAQDFFPPSLQPVLPDLVADRVTLVFESFQLIRADLAQIAEDMSAGLAIDITPPRPGAEVHSGQIEL